MPSDPNFPSSRSPSTLDSTSSAASTPPQPLTSQSPTPRQKNAPLPQATVFDAARTIQWQDLTTFYQRPCARESLLTGIGAGFAVGGLRFITLIGSQDNAASAAGEKIWRPSTAGSTSTTTPKPNPASPSVSQTRTLAIGTRVWKSMTWAVLSFSIFSVGAHLYCQRKRAMEATAMARAAEIVARKRDEKRAEMVRMRQERDEQRRARETRRLEHEVQKGSWSRLGRWFGSSNEDGGSDNATGKGAAKDKG